MKNFNGDWNKWVLVNTDYAFDDQERPISELKERLNLVLFATRKIRQRMDNNEASSFDMMDLQRYEAEEDELKSRVLGWRHRL